MVTRPAIGFLLLDASLAPVFADTVVQNALTEKGPHPSTFTAGLARFRSLVEHLISAGQTTREFDFAGHRWRWSHFSCNCCEGGPQTLHAFVVGPTEQQATYTSALAAMYRLTLREAQALEFYLQGISVKEVAQSMEITPSTAKTFLRSICGKMGVSSRSELMSRVLNFTCSASFNCPFKVVMASPGTDKAGY